MRLRHLVIRRSAGHTVERIQELIGHLVPEYGVAYLLYRHPDNPMPPLLIASQGKETVGLCGWRQDEGIGVLGPVAVRADKRRWGVGSALVAQAIDEMRVEGVRSIEAVYRAGDPAGERLLHRYRFRYPENEPSDREAEWTRVIRVLKKS